MSAADLVAQLAAAGTPPELLAAVAQELFLGESERSALAARRQSDRDRKAKSRDVTGQGVTGEDTPPSPPNEYISNPPVPPVEASASTAPKGRDRGSKIPEDWSPPPIAELSPEAKALAEKWPAASYRAEAEAFRNFWLAEAGARARKTNWNRAWANRIVAVNGQVMRQAKFVPPDPKPARGYVPRTADECERSAAFWESQGKSDKAAEMRAKAAELRATGPPSAIAAIISNAGTALRSTERH